jgi:GNAT superfamily N-acetyltransferase
MIWRTSYADILSDPNAARLLAEYAEECSIAELGTPSPQPELYALMERSGGMQAFAVTEDGVLVGFAVVLVYVLPHYGVKVATTESIFIAEPFRKASKELMDSLKTYAKDKGCRAFLFSARVGSRFDRKMDMSYHFHHTSNVYLETL